MQKSLSKRIVLLTLSAILFLPAAGYSIHVSFYLGDVKLIRNGKKMNLSMGKIVKTGDIIKTGKGGTAEILYRDRTKITIREKSTAKIGNKSIKGSDNMILISGNIKGKFAKIKKGKRKVYTPTIVCAIRGTKFNLSVSKAGDTRVDLNQGKLGISNPYGNTDLKKGQKVQAGVAAAPSRKGTYGSLNKWKNRKNSSFEKNPEASADNYQKHIARFDEENKGASGNISNCDVLVKSAKGKKDILNAGSKIKKTEETVEDNFFMNDASSASIESVMKDFEGQKNDIFEKFKKLKEESNKVREQQKRNYEEIQAVKQAHREAYNKIMGKYKEDKDKILRGLNMDDVKPKIKK